MQEFLDLLKQPSTIANQIVECIDIKKTKKGMLYQEFHGDFNDRKIVITIEQPFDKQKMKVPKELLFKDCLLTIKLLPQTVLEKYMGIKAALTQQVLDEVKNNTEDEENLIDEAEEALEEAMSEEEDEDVADDDPDEDPDEDMMTEGGEPIPPAPSIPTEPAPEPEKEKKAKKSQAKKGQSILDTPHL